MTNLQISFITVKHDCVFGEDFNLDEISYVSKVQLLHFLSCFLSFL